MLLNAINYIGWETVYISENSAKKTEPPENCKGEKLSDLPEYQKLANIQYQREVKGLWISGKDYLKDRKFQNENMKLSQLPII